MLRPSGGVSVVKDQQEAGAMKREELRGHHRRGSHSADGPQATAGRVSPLEQTPLGLHESTVLGLSSVSPFALSSANPPRVGFPDALYSPYSAPSLSLPFHPIYFLAFCYMTDSQHFLQVTPTSKVPFLTWCLTNISHPECNKSACSRASDSSGLSISVNENSISLVICILNLMVTILLLI